MITVHERLASMIKDGEQLTAKIHGLQDEHFPNEIKEEREKAIEEFRAPGFTVFAANEPNVPKAWVNKAFARIDWVVDRFQFNKEQNGTILGELLSLLHGTAQIAAEILEETVEAPPQHTNGPIPAPPAIQPPPLPAMAQAYEDIDTDGPVEIPTIPEFLR